MTDSEYIQFFLATDRLGKMFNSRFLSITPEECIYEYDFAPEHTNPNGTLHGGALFSVMDSSQGALIHYDLDKKFRAAATGTATIKYLAPVTGGTIRIRTFKNAIHGRKAFLTSIATNDSGKEVATLEEVWIFILK